MHSLRYEACGKFGEHERYVRVARGVAKMNAQLTHEPIFNCFITFSRDSLNVFLRPLFADVIGMHNGNVSKHARVIEFDYTNLLAML